MHARTHTHRPLSPFFLPSFLPLFVCPVHTTTHVCSSISFLPSFFLSSPPLFPSLSLSSLIFLHSAVAFSLLLFHFFHFQPGEREGGRFLSFFLLAGWMPLGDVTSEVLSLSSLSHPRSEAAARRLLARRPPFCRSPPSLTCSSALTHHRLCAKRGRKRVRRRRRKRASERWELSRRGCCNSSCCHRRRHHRLRARSSRLLRGGREEGNRALARPPARPPSQSSASPSASLPSVLSVTAENNKDSFVNHRKGAATPSTRWWRSAGIWVPVCY